MTSCKNEYIIIIGTAKSGTTALTHFLKQHPDITNTPKDFPYFSNQAIDDKNKDYFKKLINKKTTKKILISDVNIIYSLHGLKKLNEECGANNKIIVLLRHPTDRLVSQYKYQKSKGLESRTLNEIIEYETNNFDKIKKNQNDYDIVENQANYLLHSNYPDQLKALMKTFDMKNIIILIYEDFFHSGLPANYSKLLNQLNLKQYPVEFQKVNETVYYKKSFLSNFIFNPKSLYLVKKILIFLFNIKIRKFLKRVALKFMSTANEKNIDTEISNMKYKLIEKNIISETRSILNKKLSSWN